MLYDPKWEEVSLPPPVLEPWQKILINAANLIESKGWVQGKFNSDDGKQKSYCAVGAMLRVCDYEGIVSSYDVDFSLATKMLARAVTNSKKEMAGSIFYWNDSGGQTKENVIATMRMAAETPPPSKFSRIKRYIREIIWI